MHTEYLFIYECSQRQEVHDLCAIAPNIDRTILPQTLIIEAIHLCDLTRLMISSNQCDVLGVPHFKCKQKQKCLHRVEASIDEISHEEVVGSWTIIAHFEKFHKVIELSMNVTTNL